MDLTLGVTFIDDVVSVEATFTNPSPVGVQIEYPGHFQQQTSDNSLILILLKELAFRITENHIIVNPFSPVS